jgi:hypothetical protein
LRGDCSAAELLENYFPKIGDDMPDLIMAALITAGATTGSAIGAFVVGAITNYTNSRIHKEKINAERNLAHYERIAPFAEELLAAFLEFAKVIDEIRFHDSFQGEHEGRVVEVGETSEQAALLNTYYIPIKRIKENAAFISRLQSKRYRAVALFGDEIDKAFGLTQSVVIRVSVSAHALSQMVKSGNDENHERRQRLHDYIWSSGDGDDKLSKKVSDALEIVIRICRPILSQKML